MQQRIIYCMIAVLSGFWLAFGCDLQESRLIAEQATTFEEELEFRQKKEYELENKIQKQQEYITKLEKQLECQKEQKP